MSISDILMKIFVCHVTHFSPYLTFILTNLILHENCHQLAQIKKKWGNLNQLSSDWFLEKNWVLGSCSLTPDEWWRNQKKLLLCVSETLTFRISRLILISFCETSAIFWFKNLQLTCSLRDTRTTVLFAYGFE